MVISEQSRPIFHQFAIAKMRLHYVATPRRRQRASDLSNYCHCYLIIENIICIRKHRSMPRWWQNQAWNHWRWPLQADKMQTRCLAAEIAERSQPGRKNVVWNQNAWINHNVYIRQNLAVTSGVTIVLRVIRTLTMSWQLAPLPPRGNNDLGFGKVIR
jgi:hypothetical protein